MNVTEYYDKEIGKLQAAIKVSKYMSMFITVPCIVISLVMLTRIPGLMWLLLTMMNTLALLSTLSLNSLRKQRIASLNESLRLKKLSKLKGE